MHPIREAKGVSSSTPSLTVLCVSWDVSEVDFSDEDAAAYFLINLLLEVFEERAEEEEVTAICISMLNIPVDGMKDCRYDAHQKVIEKAIHNIPLELLRL